VNQLQDENRRLKQLVADLTLDKQMLQEVRKKSLRPSAKETARWLVEHFAVGSRRACALLLLIDRPLPSRKDG